MTETRETPENVNNEVSFGPEFPERFPCRIASGWGEDEYGIWEEFTVESKDPAISVTQRLRWIPPGTFLMGSPEGEPERYKDELQHGVTLTQGFWLADTACTQALWQAVTRENLSNFNGDDNPVERVSWYDIQPFISRLNDKFQGHGFCLPSEAQWEYACRAGTTTPFSFGDNITTDQVNFDGNHPYNSGKKGKKGIYREKTVPVKSLPCNQWGLYQMHGNVWEWCADWFGDYPANGVIDPKGPKEGGRRVLRGGSWFHYGRRVRSAQRLGISPVYRFDYTGFRLARDQSAPAGE